MTARRGTRGTNAARIIVLGATSAIAIQMCRVLARDGAELMLVGRAALRLEAIAADLMARGARACHVSVQDLSLAADAQRLTAGWVANLGGKVDAVYLFFGILGDQEAARSDLAELEAILVTNFTAAAHWCQAAATILEKQKSGGLIAITSVAGDRGRQSNYAYGAAKAGLSVFVEGIAHRLAPSGARAVAVKLGMVETPMTEGRNGASVLRVSPESIATPLARLARGKSKPIIYLPWFWRPAMLAVRALPVSLFHRSRL